MGSSIFRNQPKQNSTGLNPAIIEQARQAMRGGQNYQLQGNGITLTGPGYYDIAAGATLSGSAAGTITLTAYQDGVAIPGMTASQTVKAAGDIVTLGVSGIIRNYCTKPVSTLTIVISGMAATGTNLAIDITKQ